MRDYRPSEVQDDSVDTMWPRRRLLQAGCVSAVGMALGAALSGAAQERPSPDAKPTGAGRPLTPQCADGQVEPTLRQGAGPFYTPNTPKRTSLLAPHIQGTPLVVTGQVLQTTCRPLAGVLLDFWQADDAGNYDNTSYTLRGHQFTDANGSYRLETIVPGLYPGRTRHLHVKVQAPYGRVLTTQLYLPHEPHNRRDFLYDARLVMQVSDTAPGGKLAHFDFVIPG